MPKGKFDMIDKQEIERISNKICILFRKDEDDLDYACQLLTKASILQKGCEYGIAILYFGEEKKSIFDEFNKYGADHIYLFGSDKRIDIGMIADTISEMIPEMKDVLLLFQANASGKEIATVLSTRFEIGLTADCVDIHTDEKMGFVFSRAAIGDSVIADIVCEKSNVYMCTVKKMAFEKQVCLKQMDLLIQRRTVRSKHTHSNVISAVENIGTRNCQDEDIDKYDIVFGIGRGVKNENVRQKIYEIAKKYNGVVVGTKPVIDEQWLPYSHQVGQSGKNISPKLYVALGISGASQHVVGIMNAKKVIAVNRDENAMIFKFADYYIVDNVENIVDVLEQMIDEEREENKTTVLDGKL